MLLLYTGEKRRDGLIIGLCPFPAPGSLGGLYRSPTSGQVVVDNLAEAQRHVGDDVHSRDDLEHR
jgi:hypothetical protein